MSNPDRHFDYWGLEFDLEMVTSCNVLIVAYSFQQSLFPTYNSLGVNKSNDTMKKAMIIGISLTTVIYTTLGILSIYTFGRQLTSNVFDAVATSDTVYATIIRVAFLIVLACHIPFVFLPTKESFLIIIDEA